MSEYKCKIKELVGEFGEKDPSLLIDRLCRTVEEEFGDGKGTFGEADEAIHDYPIATCKVLRRFASDYEAAAKEMNEKKCSCQKTWAGSNIITFGGKKED